MKAPRHAIWHEWISSCEPGESMHGDGSERRIHGVRSREHVDEVQAETSGGSNSGEQAQDQQPDCELAHRDQLGDP